MSLNEDRQEEVVAKGVGIKFKLIIVMLLLALVSVVGIGYYSYITIHDYLLDDAKEQLTSVLDLNGNRIEEWLEGNLTAMEKLASDNMIVPMNSAGLVQMRINYNIKEMSQFNYVFTFKPDGSLFATNYELKPEQEINISEYDYVSQIINEQQTFYGLGKSPINGETALLIGLPLINNEQQTGFAVGQINIENFYGVVNNIKTTDKYNFNIVNGQGQILYSSDQAKILQNDFYEADREELKNLEFNGDNNNLFINYQKDGQTYLASLKKFDLLNWQLIISSLENSFLQSANVLKTRIIYFGLILLALSLLVSYYLGNDIGTRIKKLEDITFKVASGDLTTKVEIKGKDEIAVLGRAINKMVVNLKELVNNITSRSNNINQTADSLRNDLALNTQSAEQVTTAIENVASGADDQAMNLENVVRIVSQMVDKINQLLENNNETAETAQDSLNAVKNGNKSMANLTDQMQAISKKVDHMSTIMEKLDETSGEIGEIVEIINNIAKQTNLLALNAAIEAARAGEHGRGFSVVAEEVRELAEESISSAEKINSLIQETQQNTVLARDAMFEEKEVVKEGIEIVDNTNTVFNKLQNLIDETYHDAIKASEVAAELVDNASDVGEKIESTASIAEEISASSQEVTASSEEQTSLVSDMAGEADKLHDLAQEMKDMVAKFKVK